MPFSAPRRSDNLPVIESGLWIILLEAAIALGLLGFIVWWTVPKKRKESPEDSKDGSHGS